MSLSSYWQMLKGVFKHAVITAKKDVVELLGSAEVKAFEVSLEGFVETEFGKICLAAVQAAKSAASGAESHQQAFAEIVTAAKAAGKESWNSMVNLGIELALQWERKTFGNS